MDGVAYLGEKVVNEKEYLSAILVYLSYNRFGLGIKEE
jgi:hypothetical protein